LRSSSDICTVCGGRDPKRQQLPNLSKRKAEFLGASNESEAAYGFFGKEAIT